MQHNGLGVTVNDTKLTSHRRARQRLAPAALLDLLEDMVSQHCGDRDGHVNSFGLRANASAIRALAQDGRVEIIVEAGKCIRARWSNGQDQTRRELP